MAWSTADADMCPVITLYTAAEKIGILEDTMNYKMMLCILRKYINRWHATPSKWKKSKLKELTEGIKDRKLGILCYLERLENF